MILLRDSRFRSQYQMSIRYFTCNFWVIWRLSNPCNMHSHTHTHKSIWTFATALGIWCLHKYQHSSLGFLSPSCVPRSEDCGNIMGWVEDSLLLFQCIFWFQWACDRIWQWGWESGIRECFLPWKWADSSWSGFRGHFVVRNEVKSWGAVASPAQKSHISTAIYASMSDVGNKFSSKKWLQRRNWYVEDFMFNGSVGFESYLVFGFRVLGYRV